jgi:hypothetical protein
MNREQKKNQAEHNLSEAYMNYLAAYAKTLVASYNLTRDMDVEIHHDTVFMKEINRLGLKYQTPEYTLVIDLMECNTDDSISKSLVDIYQKIDAFYKDLEPKPEPSAIVKCVRPERSGVLEVGKEYEVTCCEMHSFSSYYYLDGVEGNFNTCDFDKGPWELPEDLIEKMYHE